MPNFPTREEFDALMRDSRPTDDLERLAPGLDASTREAIFHVNEMLNKGLDQFMLSDHSLEMGLRPGVPFNPLRGAPNQVRSNLSFDPNVVNQFKILGQVYGLENVHFSKDERFVVRNQVNPSTGTKEDFFVDPVGIDMGDIASMSADVWPSIIAAITAKIGIKAGSRPGTKFLGGLAGMAVGTELTYATQQIRERLIAGNEIEPGTLAGERLQAALVDMTLGTFLAGGAKVGTKAVAGLLGGVGIRVGGETATVAATKKLAAKGINFPLTPGEAAESPTLMRLEATAKPSFGTVGLMGAIEAGKESAEAELKRIHLGLPRTMTDDELAAIMPKADVTGQRVLDRLGTEALRLEGNVAKATQALEQAGTTEAQALARVNLANPLESVPVGEALRNRTKSEFKTSGKILGDEYNEFFDRPEIAKKSFWGKSLAEAVDQTEAELTPSKLVAKEVATVDRYGNPTSRTRIVQERIDKFINESVKRVLDGLKGLRNAAVGPADLKMIRTNIDDAIAEGIAIPGVNVAQLNALRNNVTGAIENSLRKAGGSEALLTEWKSLNDRWAARQQRFDRTGIKQILIPEGEPGSIGNAALARSITAAEPGAALDRYTEFKQFFGAASPEFQDIQRLTRERVLKGSLQEVNDYISGPKLRNALSNLDDEVAADLFGTSKKELHRIGEALSVAQGNLPVDKLTKLASTGSLTAEAIRDLAAANREQAKAWGNNLMKAAAKGSDIGVDTMKPSDVVNNLTQLDPDPARYVLGILSDRPDLLEDVRKLSVEELWGRVQTQLKSRKGVTSTAIAQALGDETQQRTWKTILGANVVEDLETLGKIVRPSELSTRAFSGAGQMRATGEITAVEKGGFMPIISKVAERLLVGAFYVGPGRQIVINMATKGQQGRLINAMVTSTPFVESVAKRFGDDAPGIMQSLRDIVEPQHARELTVEGKLTTGSEIDLRNLSEEEFKTYLRNTTKQ